MNKKRVLLMHISRVSGHRSANIAIAKALAELNQDVQTLSIDAFSYTNPWLERLVNLLYMAVLKYCPWVWEYLYDHQGVLKKVAAAKALILRRNQKKIKELVDSFHPDVVVCTQAFPCNMVAAYKQSYHHNLPLVGVLTDYAPHSYWLSNQVDAYVVPAPKIGQRLAEKGVPGQRLKALGIPIDIKFKQEDNRQQAFSRLGLDANIPVILIMGGGQGIGPIRQIARRLDKLNQAVQFIVVCGTNQKLFNWLKKKSFRHAVLKFGYTNKINNLMGIASLIITKPGGLTTAEALSKSLPMIIFRPLPGQESQNSHFLTEEGAAIKVDSLKELAARVEELLTNPAELKQLRYKAGLLKQADSALKIAQLVLELANQQSQNRQNDPVLSL